MHHHPSSNLKGRMPASVNPNVVGSRAQRSHPISAAPFYEAYASTAIPLQKSPTHSRHSTMAVCNTMSSAPTNHPYASSPGRVQAIEPFSPFSSQSQPIFNYTGGYNQGQSQSYYLGSQGGESYYHSSDQGYRAPPFVGNAPSRQDRSTTKCTFCKRDGHTTDLCFLANPARLATFIQRFPDQREHWEKKLKLHQQRQAKKEEQFQSRPRACFKCGSTEHMINSCPQNRVCPTCGVRNSHGYGCAATFGSYH